ncbi:uncharacterized protein LOC118645242 [Monomorium pharaonis]|uniref:uncharacterized protein LOC118645242 n=1 Tax=Monomorium pharaonis TaxID=307658 RepID=UPI0017474F7A|nr:uncharacterized protein LOC118645242 [Monomorium pharaonis]
MGKSSRKYRSRSPRSHKRHKRGSRDSSGDGKRSRNPKNIGSHSREASLSVSLDRILKLLTDQKNRIAAIEANSHVSVVFPSDAPADTLSPPSQGQRPADDFLVSQIDPEPVETVAELSQAPVSVPLQPQPEEAALSQTIASVLQTEGKRLHEVSDGSYEPRRHIRCVPSSTLFVGLSTNWHRGNDSDRVLDSVYLLHLPSLDSVSDTRDRIVSFAPPSSPDAIPNKSSKRVSELFGPRNDPPFASSWDHTVLAFARDTVHNGLPDTLRTQLLSEHEVKGDLSTLGPPKINKVLLPALKSSASALKRDEAQVSHQSQLAAALNALGSGVSSLMSEDEPIITGRRKEGPSTCC